MKLSKLLTYSLIFLYACTCSRNEDLPKTKSVRITLNIRDDVGNKLTNAKVYLLATLRDYELAAGNFTGKYAIDSTVSTNGVAVVNLNSNTSYWLYIQYNDEVRKLIFTNEGYSNAINDLPKNIDISVDVKLIPTSANVGFWSASDNVFPIQVVMIEDTLLLQSPRNTAPTVASDPNIVYKTIQKGTHTYYAKNALGCAWTGKFKVKSGDFLPIKLEACELGTVVFWTRTKTSTLFPISITLNEIESMPVLQTAINSDYTCGDALTGTSNEKKMAGTYSYLALSADKKCAWQGTFVIKKDTCVSVQLKPCN
ncbi:MAG: hypothetical protein SFY32_03805 [Bacteroidota bacterium]|nr:hypothetical protein [Bacteroidota bacterium]